MIFDLQILELSADLLAVVFLELLLLVLRVEQPIGRLNLALHRLDALDRVLHVVDQAAFDRFGELDAADALRQLDARAHRGEPRPAVLPLVPASSRPFGVSASFSSSFSEPRARFPHRVDLLLHLPAALFDALVGDLLVVEDDELADRPFARVQVVAELDDPLGHERRARDRLDHGQLAALDPARNLDFALAREERDGAHLAQIHAHRVVGLVERAGREVELQLLGAFAGPVDDLASSRRYFWSESMTSMPALPKVLKRSSSSSDDVISDGSSSFTSS